jgi:hypothetical protein
MPKDLDILVKPANRNIPELDHYRSIYPRVECAWYGPSSQVILDATNGEYPSLEVLYTIKAAQLKFDIFWDKTSNDVIYFQKMGIALNEELFGLLLKDFTDFHGRRWARLEGKDNKTFFEDAVNRKYVHDTIHEAVAYYDRPLYESISTGKGVSCSKKKFKALSHEDQIKLAKEEIFVTALERFLIPKDFKESSHRAYWRSLKKFVTTMSSGWMSKFLIDNFLELSYNTDDYVARFKQNTHKLKEN